MARRLTTASIRKAIVVTALICLALVSAAVSPSRPAGASAAVLDALSLPLVWTTSSEVEGADYGVAVSTAGDVNGDNYDDVIIGAARDQESIYREGVALVFHGSGSGLNTTASWIAGGGQQGAQFGFAASAAGDVNGDGYDDVIVGAPEHTVIQAKEGRVYLFYGSALGLSTAPDWIYEGEVKNGYLGYAVGAAGDVNGDGYDDVIAGARWYSNGETNEGAALVFYGSASGPGTEPDWSLEGNQAGAGLGHSVSTAGDVNGDGYDEVVVGAPFYDSGLTNEGAAWLFYGSAGGLSATLGWSAVGGQEEARLGAAVSTAGDLNGDGLSEVIIGAPYYDGGVTDEGAAFVFFGSAGGLGAAPRWTSTGNQQYAQFGAAVGAAGDVNGDGYGDVIVGAPLYNDDQPDEGAAFVYCGLAAGLWPHAQWQAYGDKAETDFGRAAGTAGDVNHDGYSDLVVGAPLYKHSERIVAGRAFAYHGAEAALFVHVYLPLVSGGTR